MKKLLTAALLAGSMSAQAGLVTTGTLENSPAYDFDTFNFQVNTPSTVSLLLDGNTDAYLILFSGIDTFNSSTFIAQNDDGGPGLDSFLNLSLAAADYTAFLTTYGTSWNGSAITSDHAQTPMDYTLTITGDVSASTAVPEPASIALLGLALLGFGFSRKRKKKKEKCLIK